jgi:HSP20 family protein
MTTSLVPNRATRAMKSWFGRDPFRDLHAEMDNMLSQFAERWNDAGGLTETWNPSLDLSETNTDVQITMDAPGMKPEEIDIEVTGDTLRIHGEHKEEHEEKGRTFHRIERRAGSFSRFVELPCAVKEDKVAAEYKDGVLRVTLPKSEAAKTHKVAVKGNGK